MFARAARITLGGAGATGGVLAVLVITASPAAAHTVNAGSLPAPSWLLGYVGAFAVLATAVVLRGAWPKHRLGAVGAAMFDAEAAWSDDVGIGRNRPWTQRIGQVVGLIFLAGVLIAAATGPDSPAANIAPVAVFVIWWVGLPLACLAAGDVMRAINPYAPVVQWVERMRPNLPSREHLAPRWTAPVFLWVFGWYFVAYHRPGSPRATSVLLGAYALTALAGGIAWGSSWLRRGEGFGALSVGVAGLVRPRPGSAAGGLLPISIVVLSTTAFDAVSGTAWWADIVGTTTGWARSGLATVGLVWVTATTAAVAMTALRLMAPASHVDGEPDRVDATGTPEGAASTEGLGTTAVPETRVAIVQLFGVALLPAALGWFVAHDLTLLLFEGQNFIALLSDPMGRGWDLFGTIDHTIDYRIVTAGWVRWAQLSALLLGHVVAVVLAHDGAIRLLGRRNGMRITWVTASVAAGSITAAALLVLG